MKNFTNKSFYTKKIFILNFFFRGHWVPPSVSRRLLISPDFPLRFLWGPNWSSEKKHFFENGWPIWQFWRGLEVKEIFGHSWFPKRRTVSLAIEMTKWVSTPWKTLNFYLFSWVFLSCRKKPLKAWVFGWSFPLDF